MSQRAVAEIGDLPPEVAALDMESVVARLGDLPTLAPVAVEVIRLAEDENASIDQVTAAISNDPGLAVRLLSLANSAAYSRGGEVTNLSRAAMLLGLQTLKMVTLGFTLVAEMGSSDFDSSVFWRRGLESSVVARKLASQTNPELADDAFVAGLLSNIGKLALVEEPAYAKAMEEFGPWIRPMQELRMFGLTSEAVTAKVLSGWGLPSLLSEAVEHRIMAAGSEGQSELGAILQVADDVARLVLTDDDAEQAIALDSLITSAATTLGMTIGDIQEIIDELRPELEEIAELFDLPSIDRLPADDIVRSAQSQLAKLSLEMVTKLNQEQQRNDSLTELNRQLEAAASTDSLTGLPNRRTFDAYLSNQVAGRIRTPRGTMLGLIMFDLDHFKSINDTFGHSVGDEVLQEFGRRLLEGSRKGELTARIGGEEFAVVLPDVLARELAGAAERMRALIGDEPVETAIGPLTVTTSIGVSFTKVTRADAESALYSKADEALYAAKDAGRDQVRVLALDD